MDYPRSWEEFVAWFAEDDDCRDYLDWLRWPNGFVCPWCATTSGWQRVDGRWDCGGCGRVVSQTAGTVFDKTRTPLTLWFSAAWHMTNQKNGISGLGLQRELRLGSAQTAWHMLHRLRSAMVRADRSLLHDEVEVDETLDTYSHLWPDSEDRTRAAVDEVLGAIASAPRQSVDEIP